MHTAELIELSRDVDASIVPSGDKVTLQQGEQAQITQTLGGTYTVIINGIEDVIVTSKEQVVRSMS